jgi:hypothetical protein
MLGAGWRVWSCGAGCIGAGGGAVRSAPICGGNGGLVEGKVACAGVCVRGRLAGGRGGGGGCGGGSRWVLRRGEGVCGERLPVSLKGQQLSESGASSGLGFGEVIWRL